MNTEDITKDLTDSDKLNMLLTQMAAFQTWQTKVDAFIDDRARDTKPLLGQILKEVQDGFARIEMRLSTVEEESKRTRREVGMLREDMRNERLARVELIERIEDLEQRPA